MPLKRIIIFIFFLQYYFLGYSQSFICDGTLYMATSPDQVNGQLYQLEFLNSGQNLEFNKFSNRFGSYINAIGFRSTDYFLYGINPITSSLYKIDASGKATFLIKIASIGEEKNYIAGEVSRDGKHLILQGGSSIEDVNIEDTELVYIDLDPPYSQRSVGIETLSGSSVLCADVALDPLSGKLFGFDGIHNRVVIIDPNTAVIDDTKYPAVGTCDAMASLFFDSFGNLFGYGRRVNDIEMNIFYRIDKSTGFVFPIQTGPAAPGNDGCSCPYTIGLQKSVFPRNAFACTDVVYTFYISNSSDKVHNGLEFSDELPEGFEFVKILRNPFGGTLTTSEQKIEIKNMVVDLGVDSMQILVHVGDVSPGEYKNQAALERIPEFLGSQRVSDDPATTNSNDSTSLWIASLSRDIGIQVYEICEGDTLELDASIFGDPEYLWSTGESEAKIKITEGGNYWVEIKTGCEIFSDTVFVKDIGRGAQVDIGEVELIFLGEEINLNAQISINGDFNFEWSESQDSTITCYTCLETTAQPFNSTLYQFELEDEDGCKVRAYKRVIVDKSERIYFPNVFSPNDDGINDMFYFQGIEGVEVNYLKIFDRWGNQVFANYNSSLNNIVEGWDGKFNKAYCPVGVYFWTAEFEFIDGRISLHSGDLTLLK